MKSVSWRIATPVLGPEGRSLPQTRDVEVEATTFRRTGWKHVVTDHADHPAWLDVVPDADRRAELGDLARQDGETSDAAESVDELLEALRVTLQRTLARPHFVVTREDGYAVLADDPGRARSVFDRAPVETRQGQIAVDESGLIVVVSDGHLATAYFPDETGHMKPPERFREAAIKVRRKANLAGYADRKAGRYWRRTKPPMFHDEETWARTPARRKEAGHGSN